ncbi:hypothetical protein FACS189452_03390 [Bacteroidia bacterium]|nr:hypothetical protein FACS189452_03390 [Bacteroidia bacterium]GHT80257.1 hypothetical protein FACS189467_2010 [Bacteroidia bacterium]
MSSAGVKVNMQIEIKLTDLEIPNLKTRHFAMPEHSDIRMVVDIYPTRALLDDTPVARILFTKRFDGDSIYHLDTTLQLPPAHYTLLAWADFVDRGTVENKYYNAADLREVSIITNPYVGYNAQKDAHAGRDTLNISENVDNPQTVSIALKRPLAHYQVWTTDVQEYINKHIIVNDSVPPLNTWQRLKIDWNYTAFRLPWHFNVSTMQADYPAPISYQHDVLITVDTVLLAEDYVLVTEKLQLDASFSISNPKGEMVNKDVPVKENLPRNKLTRIYDKYLTTKPEEKNEGINIDDKFDEPDTIVDLNGQPYIE